MLVVFPDLQGRLMGKRVTGHYWVDHMDSGRQPIHVCNYLLAVDAEMTVLPGYEFASWDQGYGDIALQPDLTTLRLVPWLEATAMVMCDAVSEDGDAPIEVSPRRILQRQVERAAALGYTVMFASELEFFLFRESLDEAAAKDYTDLTPHSHVVEDYHVLQTTRDEYLIRAIRNGVDGAGIPVEFSKGEAGSRPARDQPRLLDAGRDGRPPRHLQERGEGDRVAVRPRDHVHGEVLGTRSRVVVPRPLERVEPRRVRVADVGCRRVRPALGRVPRLARRADRVRAGARLDVRADGELVQALPARVVGADRTGMERRQPHVRIPHRRHGFRRSGMESRIPGADVNPYLAYAATIAAGLHGIERGIDPPARFDGNAYAATDVERVPASIVEAIEAFGQSKVAADAFGTDVHDHLLNTARQEWLAFGRAVTDWERRRNFDQW